jgi:hypothetical protein
VERPGRDAVGRAGRIGGADEPHLVQLAGRQLQHLAIGGAQPAEGGAQVAIQAPPNTGGLNPTGKLGVDAAPTVGFDIFSGVRDGVARANKALASLVVDGRARLYEIDPLTGQADGSFERDVAVVDIAIPFA